MITEEIFKALFDSLDAKLDRIESGQQATQEQIGGLTNEVAGLRRDYTDHVAADSERFDKLEKSSAETTLIRRTDEAVRAAQALIVSEAKADVARKDAQKAALRQGVIVAACATIFGVLATIAFSHVSLH